MSNPLNHNIGEQGTGLQTPIPLSALQHAVFCLRQAALIHLERLWEENVLTAEGRILHERVDLPSRLGMKSCRRTTALPLASQQFFLSGVSDVVEFYRIDGIEVPYPVEYKRGRPKLHRADEVQLCAQALCLEEMFKTPVPEGALYYAQTRRRVVVPFDSKLKELTVSTITSLIDVFLSQKTPPPSYQAQRCKSCSLFDACRPKDTTKNVMGWRKNMVLSITTEEMKA